MNRKPILIKLGSALSILFGFFLLIYKVVLADIDVPSPESILEIRGNIESIVEKTDGILIKLDGFEDVFFLSHRTSNLRQISSLLHNLKEKEVVISVKSNGDYIPYSSNDVFRLFFGISSRGETIMSYSEIVKNWKVTSRKKEVAAVAFLFIFFGLYSIWKSSKRL